MMNTAKKHAFTQFELSKAIITSNLFSQIKLSPSARLVLIVLCTHYPKIYPSIETIKKESGISSKTSVINAIKELASSGLLFYETKNVNHYSFRPYFFETLNIEPEMFKNWNSNGTKNEPKQNNKKINNKTPFNNQKDQTYKTVAETREEINRVLEIKPSSPLDMPKDEAVNWYNSLIPELKNSFFARKIREKWNL